MKRPLALAPLLAVLVLALLAGHGEATPPPTVEVWFSPGLECTQAAVRTIDGARQEVLVDAYGFSNPAVLAALSRARGRGVAVRLVLDAKTNRSKSEPATMLAAGAEVWFDGHEPIHHVKAITADRAVTFAGSWNLTHQAEKNDEDCLVLRDASIARRYAENWERHRAHAELIDEE